MKKDAIYRAHVEHPEWHGAKIARHVGVSPSYVTKTAKALGLDVPAGAKAKRDGARTVMKLGWAAVNAGLTIADIEQAAQIKRASA